jgi:hypothetical protein
MDEHDIAIIANQTGCSEAEIREVYAEKQDITATIMTLMNYKACANRNKKTPVAPRLTEFRAIMAEKEQIYLERLREATAQQKST